MPVVEAVGVVSGRRRELEAVLITRHLDFSLPYRALFGTRGMSDLRDEAAGALAELLVRLHLAGFFWGDCSLSNTLFRRDAGRSRPTSWTRRPASCTRSSPTASAARPDDRGGEPRRAS